MVLPLRRYADFRGRSRRKEFWWFVVFNTLITGVLTAGVFATLGVAGISAALESGPLFLLSTVFFSGAGMLLIAYGIAMIIPTIALNVRRFHDLNLSGWWYLATCVASVIPIIGSLAGLAAFVVTVLPGNVGGNRFGPDPRDESVESVFA